LSLLSWEWRSLCRLIVDYVKVYNEIVVIIVDLGKFTENQLDSFIFSRRAKAFD